MSRRSFNDDPRARRVRTASRPRQKNHKKEPFCPSDKQVTTAQSLICRVLKNGKLYAANVREAAYLLRKKIGYKARQLGNTPRQSQVTLERGLMDLLGSKRVTGTKFGFSLAA